MYVLYQNPVAVSKFIKFFFTGIEMDTWKSAKRGRTSNKGYKTRYVMSLSQVRSDLFDSVFHMSW